MRLGIGILYALIHLRSSVALPLCGPMSDSHPVGKFTWLDTLGTFAINKPDLNTAYVNIAQMLTDASSYSVGSQSNQLALGNIPPNLWDGTSTSFGVGISNACGTCLLSFVNNLIALTNTGYISNDCDHASSFVRVNCIHSISTALVAFNLCNDPDGTSDLVQGTGAARCAQSDLVALDVNYGIYENIVSKVLYADFSSGRSFSNSLTNLPCQSCFVTFYSTLTSYGIANMLSVNACGPLPGRDSIFLPSCFSAAGGSNVGQGSNKITTAIFALEQCLGGGFTISLHSKPDYQLRCNPNELNLLSAYSLFSPIIQCSLSDLATSFDSVTKSYSSSFKTCMENSVWGSNAFDLISGSPNVVSVTCWGCFGALVKILSTESLSMFTPHLVDLCTGPGKSSFHPKCIAALTGAGYLDFISQCVGGYILSTLSTTCSPEESVSGTLASFAIPPIAVAYIASNNPWIVTDSSVISQKVSAMKMYQSILGEYISINRCFPCYKALSASMVETMIKSIDNRIMCENLFSDSCLENTFVLSNLQSFAACSGGYSLTISESPYMCSSSESDLIQSKSIPQLIFLISVVSRAKSTTQAILTLQTYLQSIDQSINCAPCLERLVVSLFNLSDSDIAKCLIANSVSECFMMSGFLDTMIEYQRCSGLRFEIESNEELTSTTEIPTTISVTSTTKNNGREFSFLIVVNFFLINYLIFS